MRLLVTLFALLYCLSVQAQQVETTEEQQQQDSTEQVEASTEAELEEGAEEEEDSPSRFIPTEEISQDLGVSFPVDI